MSFHLKPFLDFFLSVHMSEIDFFSGNAQSLNISCYFTNSSREGRVKPQWPRSVFLTLQCAYRSPRDLVQMKVFMQPA